MSFLKTISYMLSNELDRTLLSLLDSNPDSFLDEKSYNKLLEVLRGQNARFTKADAVNSLLKSAQKQIAWPGALRHLMVMHKLIHDFGEECYAWISSDKMQHLNQFKTPEPSLKLFVHKALVSYYYNYLQKLSYSYNDLRICFHFDEQFPDKLAEENISPLHSVSKLQNTLRYLMQIFSLIEASIVEFTPSNLVKQVAYFCFTDCYYYYTYINQVVSSLFTQVLNLPAQDAIAIYEIYSEHLIITRKLKTYFPIIKSLPEFALRTPEFYNFDTEYNTRIELYISSLRPRRQNSLKPPSKTMPAINTIPNISINQCDESCFSLKDASLLITEIVASSNACIPQTTGSLFEPPMVRNKKKTAVNMRIIHPGEKHASVPTTIQTKGKHLDFDRSIEIQRTRGSVMPSHRVDASSQFDKSIGDDQLLHINSTYPLAPGESFLKEDSNSNTANNSIIHGVC